MKNQLIISRSCICFLLLFLLLCGFSGKSTAQQSNADSIYAARLMEDNLALYNRTDSLEKVITRLHNQNNILRLQVDSLQACINLQSRKLAGSKNRNDSLQSEQINLQRQLLAGKQEKLQLGTQLEQQAQLLRDKDFQLSKAEQELRELKTKAEISTLKLESRIDVHNSQLEGKDKEIAYLQKSADEKDRLVREKTEALASFYREKDNSLHIIDSLSRALNQKEMDYIKVSERLKIIESQYNEILAKQTAATNKKKKIRFIQGVGLKNYRTPDWQLTQNPTGSDLVITNKNAGKLDFDYITGVSISLIDLTKKESNFTYDAGLFFGFGGQNLFKNFYIGPSFKILDYFHLSLGVNAAEYQQLQNGYSEGQHATTIALVKEWKTNIYLGFTVDLELLANIPKKF